jgi:PhzF family phenazine biosynthesis protein
MKLAFYQVDAFAERPFQGNPAAVFILESWLPDQIMQAIAMEMNLSESVFCVRKDDGDFRIRWFTPTTEVKLCGHATIATAHVLYQHYGVERTPLTFHSRSGQLIASPDSFGICLDFPADPPSPIRVTMAMAEAMGAAPSEAFTSQDEFLILLYSDASEVEILSPDLAKVKELPYQTVVATAPGNGNGYDFVSRMFGPAIGIDEDPVTGATHTRLTPLYSMKTGKDEFFARQCSSRGGDLKLALQGDRVFISGKAVTVVEGHMELPSF